MNAIGTARTQQISEMRGAAASIRKGILKTAEQAADWQKKANEARQLVAVLEEKARLWDALADGMETGTFHDAVACVVTGSGRPTNLDIHALQGRLMAELPEYDLDAWNIAGGVLKAMLHRLHGGSPKAIGDIADRLNLRYVEDPHSDSQVCVAAKGKIDGIPVEIWSLLPADEVARPVEHVDYAEAEDVREIEREMAIEAGDDSEIDRQVAEDDARAERWAEENAANQYSDAHYNVDDDDEDGAL